MVDPEIVRQQQEAEREAMKLAALKPPAPVLANSQIPARLEQISVMGTKTWVASAFALVMLPALVSVPRHRPR